jgi:hypothetical protein
VTPGDARALAREIASDIIPHFSQMGPLTAAQLLEIEKQILRNVAAALQSERTAAASQARRDAFAECAAKIRNMRGGWPTGAGDSDEWTLDDVADALMRALATPQESEK